MLTLLYRQLSRSVCVANTYVGMARPPCITSSASVRRYVTHNTRATNTASGPSEADKTKAAELKKEYALLRKKINLFILHIHPDRFVDQPSVRDINQRSLVELNAYLSEVDSQTRSRSRTSTTPLTFFARLDPTNTEKVRRVKVSLSGAQESFRLPTAISLLTQLLSSTGLIDTPQNDIRDASDEPSEREQMEELFNTKLDVHFLSRRSKFKKGEGVPELKPGQTFHHGRGNVMPLPPQQPHYLSEAENDSPNTEEHTNTYTRTPSHSRTHSGRDTNTIATTTINPRTVRDKPTPAMGEHTTRGVQAPRYETYTDEEDAEAVAQAERIDFATELISEYASRGLLSFDEKLTHKQQVRAIKSLTNSLPHLEFTRWSDVPMILGSKYSRQTPGVLEVPFNFSRAGFRSYFFKNIDSIVQEMVENT